MAHFATRPSSSLSSAFVRRASVAVRRSMTVSLGPAASASFSSRAAASAPVSELDDRLMPSVRVLFAEHGLTVRDFPASLRSGAGGRRILKADVLRLIREGPRPSAATQQQQQQQHGGGLHYPGEHDGEPLTGHPVYVSCDIPVPLSSASAAAETAAAVGRVVADEISLEVRGVPVSVALHHHWHLEQDEAVADDEDMLDSPQAFYDDYLGTGDSSSAGGVHWGGVSYVLQGGGGSVGAEEVAAAAAGGGGGGGVVVVGVGGVQTRLVPVARSAQLEDHYNDMEEDGDKDFYSGYLGDISVSDSGDVCVEHYVPVRVSAPSDVAGEDRLARALDRAVQRGRMAAAAAAIGHEDDEGC